MLLAALSRANLSDRFSSFSYKQFALAPGWVLTIVTDGLVSSIQVSDDEIVGTESLLCGLNGADVRFVTVRFSRKSGTLEIVKASISGRPVYYHLASNGDFLISSHISMLRQAGVAIEENTEVIPELLIYRTVAPPRTLYRKIEQLPAAGEIIVRPGEHGCALTLKPGYWPSDEVSKDTSEADISARTIGFLRDAVLRLKPASLKVATLLSGGVDSSILCRLVTQQLGAYDTYSSGYPFEDPEQDFERTYALSAAAAFSTRHNLFLPNSLDFLLGFVEALWVAETPLDHLQSVLLHLLFKQGIPKHLDRVVHGAAAEVAWGTDAHMRLDRSGSLRQRFLSMEPALLALGVMGRLWPKALAVREEVETITRKRLPFADPQNPIWAIGAYGDPEWVQLHWQVSAGDIVRSRIDNLQAFAHRPLNHVLAQYIFNFQVSTNVALWSKLAEGQRKILYYPFASQDLLDFAFSLPWDLKLKSAKYLLRESGRALQIPDAILDRPKRSFGINSDRWPERDGVLEPLISVAAKVVDIKQLRALQGRAGRRAMTLWSLLNYAVLKRLVILNESVDVLRSEVADNYDHQLRQQGHSQDARQQRSLSPFRSPQAA
jgi:asparagine synthetase B (glutamine-hydrolysing)